MSINGVWGFVYAGEAGIGIGGISVKDGQFRGTDSGMIVYSGTITEDPATHELHITMTSDIPAGTKLVGGAGPLQFDSQRKSKFTLPPRFGELTPVDFPIFPGKTTVIFKQVPEQEYSAYVERGFRIVLK